MLDVALTVAAFANAFTVANNISTWRSAERELRQLRRDLDEVSRVQNETLHRALDVLDENEQLRAENARLCRLAERHGFRGDA